MTIHSDKKKFEGQPVIIITLEHLDQLITNLRDEMRSNVLELKRTWLKSHWPLKKLLTLWESKIAFVGRIKSGAIPAPVCSQERRNALLLCFESNNQNNENIKNTSDEKETFWKKYNIAEDQFSGKEKNWRWSGFEVTHFRCRMVSRPVGGSLYLSSLTSLCRMVSRLLWAVLWLSSFHFGRTVLWIHSSLPDGFAPLQRAVIWLSSLLRCRMVSPPSVGGYLVWVHSTSLPDGFAPYWGGDLDLGSLTSLPDGFAPCGRLSGFWGSLTSLCRMVSRLWAVLCIWVHSLRCRMVSCPWAVLWFEVTHFAAGWFRAYWGGYLDLSPLTSFCRMVSRPTVGGSLYLVTHFAAGWFRALLWAVLWIWVTHFLPDGFAPPVGSSLVEFTPLRCRMVSRPLWAVLWIWVPPLRCRMVSRPLGGDLDLEFTQFAAGWFRAHCGRWSGFEGSLRFAAGWFPRA